VNTSSRNRTFGSGHRGMCTHGLTWQAHDPLFPHTTQEARMTTHPDTPRRLPQALERHILAMTVKVQVSSGM